MGGERTYLDHNASSPLRPEARAAMLAAFEVSGNASSVHHEGRAVRAIVERARDLIAARLGVEPRAVVFTSSASEANNQAIAGLDHRRIIVSAVEHASIVHAAEATARKVQIAPVDGDGVVDVDRLADLLGEDSAPAFVAVMAANNETGVRQPVAEIGQVVHAHGGHFHVDAVQAFARGACSLAATGADSMAISSHKIGGPHGAGALIVAEGVRMRPLIHGGGQEAYRRAGTENAAAIAGFAAAAEVAGGDEERNRIKALRDRLESETEALAAPVTIFARNAPRLDNTTCLAITGIDAAFALMSLDLDGIAVSSGSACSSGKVERSHVLTAMGVPDALAASAIRVSLGWSTTARDIDRFMASLGRLAGRVGRSDAA